MTRLELYNELISLIDRTTDDPEAMFAVGILSCLAGAMAVGKDFEMYAVMVPFAQKARAELAEEVENTIVN